MIPVKQECSHIFTIHSLFDIMKILLPFFTLAVSSCTQHQQTAKPAPADTVSTNKVVLKTAVPENSTTALAQYKEYLASLDKQQPNNVKAAVLNYLWLFKQKDTAVCDSGYALFNEFYEETARFVQNHLSPEDIPVKRKKEVLLRMKQYGFGTEVAEGTLIYKTDRDSINPRFYPYVSATMKQFMVQQHIETNNGHSSGEGSMAISPEAFAKRYIFWQQFRQQHPGFLMKHWVFAYCRTYADDLVFGMENTPLQEDGKLTAAYDTIYTLLLTNYSGEKFAACYKKYFEALKINDAAFVESFKENFRNGSSEKSFPGEE